MLISNASGLKRARSMEELFRDLQPTLSRHGTQHSNLFRTGLFVRQHDRNVAPFLESSKSVNARVE